MAEETKKPKVEEKKVEEEVVEEVEKEVVEEKEEKGLKLKFESTVKALGLDGPEVELVKDLSQFEILVKQGDKEFVVGKTLVE